MYITVDGIRLNAQLDKPAGFSGKCPLVVIIHGFTGHMEERHILAVSQAFNECGLATLRADMYGHGHSDGEFKDHTLYKWLTCALAVIDYARGLDFVTDLYLCGHSQGGLTTVLAGVMKRDVLKGLIPLSPAMMIPEYARRGELFGCSFDPDHVPDVLDNGERLLGGNYVRVAQTIYPEQAVDRFTGPVLIVHGDEDEAVPYSYAVDTAKRYANAELVTIPGDNHCYDHHLDQVTAAIKEWIAKQL